MVVPLLAATFTVGVAVGAAGFWAAMFWAWNDDDPAADYQRWLAAKEPRR